LANIISIACQSGPHDVTPQDMNLFVENWIDDPYAQKKFRFLIKDQSIGLKHMFIPDFSTGHDEQVLYKDGKHLPTTEDRMRLFADIAVSYGMETAQKAIDYAQLKPSDITHIITVSCTGLLAPGLETLIAQRFGLHTDVHRHAINFMGCYAAFHALRLAKMIVDNDSNAHVLIICAEVCSLHFRDDTRDDNLLSTYLFGDGVAACIVTGHERKKAIKSLEILNTSSVLISEGSGDMGWYVGNTGFEMILNKNVPKHIYKHMKTAFESCLKNIKLKPEEINHYAIHPGGKNILKAFEESLSIASNDLKWSYNILKNYGNMSSATIFYVLNAWLNDIDNKKDGDVIYSAAFGPGLSVESALLKYHNYA